MGVIRSILQLRKLRLTGEVACLKSHNSREGEIGLEPQSVQLQILYTIHCIFKSLSMYQLVMLSAAANNTLNKMGVYFRCIPKDWQQVVSRLGGSTMTSWTQGLSILLLHHP